MKIIESDFESDSNAEHPVGSIVTVIPTFVKSSSSNKDNLPPSNSYYKVTKSFNAQIRVGTEENTNTYYGAAKLLGCIFEVISVPSGSEIHKLHGGLFLIMGGSPHELRSKTFDFTNLTEIPPLVATKVSNYRPQTKTKETE
jgi:hypothetical protein